MAGAYKPRVLVYVASPRKYGSVAQLIQIAVRGVQDAGGLAEVVYLYEYNIKPCIGCVSDSVKYCKYPCIIEDDFNKLAQRLIESDGFILATPAYWYAPSGVLKNFIDRLTSLENMIFHGARSLLEGKAAGFIVAGADSGVFMTVAYLMAVMNSMGVIIPPWSMAYTHSNSPLEDEGAIRDAYNVGYLLVETIRAIREYGVHIGYNPNVDTRDLARLVKEYLSSVDEERKERIKYLDENTSSRYKVSS
ncbi:MAG: flavodoxin family protein [Desulfurococcaceae archaeon]|nr:flavodoxin family protein [Desulfurococcaceae archaeon]